MSDSARLFFAFFGQWSIGTLKHLTGITFGFPVPHEVNRFHQLILQYKPAVFVDDLLHAILEMCCYGTAGRRDYVSMDG